MNPEILCRWLGLPGTAWPPDPYTLLGLPAGERDPARIEQQVQERMARLRGYQISHPEEATEGMNRVAQAFLALMETAPAAAPPGPKAAPAEVPSPEPVV